MYHFKSLHSLAGPVIAICAVLTSFAASSPARASDCSMDRYNHNGSVMEVRFCDFTMHISYESPRPGLARNGVTPGTLLIDAKTSGNGNVEGNARVFKRGCEPLKYKVHGRIDSDRIELTGKAPVRDDDCSIVRFHTDALHFDMIKY